MRRSLIVFVVVLSVLGLGAPTRAATSPYTDVPADHWAATAIQATAVDRTWMSVAGTTFGPSTTLSRRLFSRAIVRAFAPSESPDTSITFTDLPADDPFYRYAAVAVKHGWMLRSSGAFRPSSGVTKREMDRAVVRGLGLTNAVLSLRALHTDDAETFTLPPFFGEVIIAEQLGLHFNFPTSADANEHLPTQAVTRADGAYALWRSIVVTGTWRITEANRFTSITLPAMDAARKGVLDWLLAYAGYPYIYGGEWYRPTPDGYCCGAQPQGGFDCSGLVWWALKADATGWHPSIVRPYAGWPLTERRASLMANAAPARLSFEQLAPLDVVFFDTDGSGTDYQAIDHAGLYLGNGWFLHSPGIGGVMINWMGDGWWRSHYTWGRRVADDPPAVDPAA